MSHSDQELLSRMGRDDEVAYHEIYKKYAEKLFAYALNICKQRETCEDIVQNVFISLWEKRKKNKITYLKPYLYQATKFQVVKTLRKHDFSHEELTRLNLVDASLSISKKLEFDELLSLTNSLVNNLTPRCRQIFIMSRFEDKSNLEISQELGLSIQSVKNQITKATKRLKEQISPEQLAIYQLLLFVLSL